ncbi:MAG: type IV pili methyl-accepting chemotaxis transducer N-terminal domain-containing protein [Burkholderiales bacterium]|nr:type IV pili methyl-accepting chemotaxis transducer N-terminal domain-containing protein [Burkholderiales bacterium]
MKTLDCSVACFSSRRALIQGAAAVALYSVLTPAQAQLAMSTAINRAARNRALSQRMAKAYCQILLGVLPEESARTLADARKQVRRGFDDLAKVPWPADLARHVMDIQKHADTTESLLVIPATRESVAAVAQQSDRMMAAAQSATEAFEKAARINTAKLVNTAGRQRALSQRMARDYFLAAARLDGKGLREQMKADATEFRLALDALAAAPISTPAIRNELELGKGQWLFFEAALQRKPDDKGMETLATTSERLLEVMDKLTDLYDAALKEVLG